MFDVVEARMICPDRCFYTDWQWQWTQGMVNHWVSDENY